MLKYRKLFFCQLPMFLSILVFALTYSGCSAIYRSGFVSVPRQELSGALTIGSEWIEIIPPAPLKTYGTRQAISVEYSAQGFNYTDDEKGEILNLADGRKTKIEAFLYDSQGEEYELQMIASGFLLGRKWVKENIATTSEYIIPKFPTDRTYTKLKIRSEIPIDCKKIEWIGYNPK